MLGLTITLAPGGTKRSIPPSTVKARRTSSSGSPCRATTRSGTPTGVAEASLSVFTGSADGAAVAVGGWSVGSPDRATGVAGRDLEVGDGEAVGGTLFELQAVMSGLKTTAPTPVATVNRNFLRVMGAM